MSDHLATYLHDHLAGSHFAVKLLGSLHDQYEDEPLGQFAHTLCVDLKQDQEILEQIIRDVGEAHFDLTEAIGWFTERASQFKLHRDSSGAGLGTYEAIEAITLGIRGKLALWKALPEIRNYDARIPDRNFSALAERAEEQYGRAEQQRLNLVPETFRPQPN